MATQPHALSWEGVRAGLDRIAKERGEWAGIPMPVDGIPMVIEPRYPWAKGFGQMADHRDRIYPDPPEEVKDAQHINTWLSDRYCVYVHILRRDGKYFAAFTGKTQSPMLLQTLGAARSWDVNAEVKAMEKLRSHVTPWQFECYFMTGMFLETSPRSGVTYLFRRLRPTLAIKERAIHGTKQMCVLCALCLHPIGYFRESWAGAMVPTDDVIAHLLLMRADEHWFWKKSNQHPATAPEAGI